MRADYDEEMEDEMDMEYTEYGYPFMYGEAVEVRHDRYMRSHGKKASGGTGTWMFTHKNMGDVDYNNAKEVHSANGKFTDAKKSAQQWAKKHGHSTVYVMESVELDENIGGLFKDAAEWEKSAKARGLTVKSMTHPSGEATKYHIAKDKQGNNRGHFDHGARTGRLKEEVELDEQAMTFQNAEKIKNKHLAAMDHHKKSGNSKGYAAHSMVVRKFEDAYDRHGTGVIPAGRILSASQKAFKDHPHSGMKESVELDEAIKRLPIKDVMQASKIFADAKKKGSLNSEAEAMVLDFAIKKLKYSKKDAEMLAQKAEVKHIDMVGEEVELDEVSDKMLDRYRQKAFADQPAGDDGSDKYRKRKFGRDLAFAKQTGRAKVLATKEEVELDEGKKKGLWDNIHARRKKGLPPKKPGEEGYPKTLDIREDAIETNEEIDYKVSVDGLPDMYIKAKSPAEIKTKLRKIVKKPDTIQSVERVTKSMLNKIFRDKAMGKEEPNDTEE
jgi:hypothetical protein